MQTIINHYKDPYWPTRIQWNVTRALSSAQLSEIVGRVTLQQANSKDKIPEKMLLDPMFSEKKREREREKI